jgi:hypothetical protein
MKKRIIAVCFLFGDALLGAFALTGCSDGAEPVVPATRDIQNVPECPNVCKAACAGEPVPELPSGCPTPACSCDDPVPDPRGCG